MLVRNALVEADMDVWFADSDLNYDLLICNQSSARVNDSPSISSQITEIDIIRPQEIKGFEVQLVQFRVQIDLKEWIYNFKIVSEAVEVL